MTKSPVLVILLAVFAGAAAGMAVQLTDLGTQAPDTGLTADAGRNAKQIEVENLVNRDADRITQAEIAIEELKSLNADLRDQLAAQAERIEELSEASGSSQPLAGGGMQVVGPDGEPMKMVNRPIVGFGSAGRGFKLASLPEEEKWAKLREELSLDSYQESELKQIAADYKKAMSEMFTTEDGGFKIGKLDLMKIMKAKTDSEKRVKNLLSEQQYEKYRKEGYGSAVGLGGNTTVSVSTSFGDRDSSEGK
jgi:hypothetical protein